MKCFLISLLIFFNATGCTDRDVAVMLTVKALAPTGEPIADAEVYLDKKKIGSTNAFGSYTYEFVGKRDERRRLEIRKSSAQHYYAPHVETMLLPRERQISWAVKPTLYTVPKPKHDVMNSQKTSLASSSLDNNLAIPLERYSVESFMEGSRIYFVQKKHQMTVEASAQAEFKELDSVGISASQEQQNAFYKTVHLFRSSTPVADAVLFSCEPNKEPTLLCKSNARGRCTIKDIETLKSSVSIMAMHQGHRTIVLNGPFDFAGNLRLSMTLGRSVNVFAYASEYGRLIPADSVPLQVVQKPKIHETSQCGFVSWDQDEKSKETSQQELYVVATHKDYAEAHIAVGQLNSDKPFHRVELIKSNLPAPTLYVDALYPVHGVGAEDLLRFFSNANRERYQGQVRAAFKAFDVSHSQSKDEATHIWESFLTRQGSQILLVAQISDRNSRVVWSAKESIESSDENQEKALRRLVSKAKASFFESKTSKSSSKEVISYRRDGRWLVADAEPRPEGISFVIQGHQHNLTYTDSVIDIGDATSVVVKAPPGYADVTLQLANQAGWFDLTGQHRIKFEMDFLYQVKSKFAAMDLAGARVQLESIPVGHHQWYEAQLILCAMAEKSGTQDREALASISQRVLTTDALPEEQVNAFVAKAILSTLAEEVEDRRKLALEAMISYDANDLRSEERFQAFKATILVHAALAKSQISSVGEDIIAAAEVEAFLGEFHKIVETSSPSKRHDRLRAEADSIVRQSTSH